MEKSVWLLNDVPTTEQRPLDSISKKIEQNNWQRKIHFRGELWFMLSKYKNAGT